MLSAFIVASFAFAALAAPVPVLEAQLERRATQENYQPPSSIPHIESLTSRDTRHRGSKRDIEHGEGAELQKRQKHFRGEKRSVADEDTGSTEPELQKRQKHFRGEKRSVADEDTGSTEPELQKRQKHFRGEKRSVADEDTGSTEPELQKRQSHFRGEKRSVEVEHDDNESSKKL